MLEIKLTDEEWELKRSYDRKHRTKANNEVTPEERAARRKYDILRYQLYPMKACIKHWRASAKERGIGWCLTEEYLTSLMLNTKNCPFLGIELSYQAYSGKGCSNHNPARASLDRIDSSKPYTEDNVQIVSWLYNRMKGSLTDEQLLFYCKTLVKNSENKNYGFFS